MRRGPTVPSLWEIIQFVLVVRQTTFLGSLGYVPGSLPHFSSAAKCARQICELRRSSNYAPDIGDTVIFESAVTSLVKHRTLESESAAVPKHPERPLRIEAIENCTIIRENGRRVDGLLVNVSDEGFCVESDDPLERSFEVGERLEMHVVGVGRIFGVVRWSECKRAGGVLEPYSRGAFES